MGKKKILLGILGVALVCALFFTLFISCDDIAGATVEKVVAETPQLDGDPPPESVVLEPNSSDSTFIEVQVAAPTDGGALTYQWYYLEEVYSDPKGQPITGATGTSLEFYDIDDVGVFHVYLEITNTKSGAETTVLRGPLTTITVIDPAANPQFPIITQNPADTDGMAGDIPIVVVAELPTGAPGVLTYQWYENTRAVNTGGTAISGATTAELTKTLTAGTYYYYVVVTNTTSAGTKTRTSHAATVKIISSEIVSKTNATITFNLNRKYQYVRGFGGMDIPWSNFTAIKMDEYRKMFTADPNIAYPNRLGFNMIRIMIMPGVILPGASDIDNINTSDDIDITMNYYVNNTYIDSNGENKGAGNSYRPDYYNGVKLVNENGGYVLASPWSPPPKWKSNRSKNGGRGGLGEAKLLPANYQVYADYLNAFAKHMSDKGAPIYAISIQNEPNYNADYDGCEWEPNEMRDFFKAVGHFTTNPGAVKGWGGGKETDYVLTMNGESANHPNINDAAMDDPVSQEAIDVLGRHTYGDAQNRYAKGINAGKEVWMTEHNINSGNVDSYPNDYTWNYVWVFLNDLDLSIRLNDESAFIWWALRRFYSFVGEGQYGTTEGSILPRGYAMSHYAKFAKEMYRCGVNVQGTLADGTTNITTSQVNATTLNRNGVDAKVTAFISEDGNTLSVVMYTPTSATGTNGKDLGNIEIQMPQGFKIASAVAMRSTKSEKAKRESVAVSNDKTKAYVTLPPSNILSVRFTKAAN